MGAHLFELKETSFVLWRPAKTAEPPKLVMGEFSPGNPPSLANRKEFTLKLFPGRQVTEVDSCELGVWRSLSGVPSEIPPTAVRKNP